MGSFRERLLGQGGLMQGELSKRPYLQSDQTICGSAGCALLPTTFLQQLYLTCRPAARPPGQIPPQPPKWRYRKSRIAPVGSEVFRRYGLQSR